MVSVFTETMGVKGLTFFHLFETNFYVVHLQVASLEPFHIKINIQILCSIVKYSIPDTNYQCCGNEWQHHIKKLRTEFSTENNSYI